jgi:hypothetical protein
MAELLKGGGDADAKKRAREASSVCPITADHVAHQLPTVRSARMTCELRVGMFPSPPSLARRGAVRLRAQAGKGSCTLPFLECPLSELGRSRGAATSRGRGEGRRRSGAETTYTPSTQIFHHKGRWLNPTAQLPGTAMLESIYLRWKLPPSMESRGLLPVPPFFLS